MRLLSSPSEQRKARPTLTCQRAVVQRLIDHALLTQWWCGCCAYWSFTQSDAARQHVLAVCLGVLSRLTGETGVRKGTLLFLFSFWSGGRAHCSQTRKRAPAYPISISVEILWGWFPPKYPRCNMNGHIKSWAPLLWPCFGPIYWPFCWPSAKLQSVHEIVVKII